ncbi:MAG TPA: glycosyltransferase, partial [Thermomicrobiales bacterium]|nr:glycosyltransferase [Thermomicrobiales bacterium]
PAVELRGRARHDEMEAIYSSADFLLQASLREWSGLAVLEAMSCGCIPIVTNIPSFSAMTSDGTYGRLFQPGDAEGLASAALEIDAAERERLSEDVRNRFRESLSFEALARDVERVYLEVCRRSG